MHIPVKVRLFLDDCCNWENLALGIVIAMMDQHTEKLSSFDPATGALECLDSKLNLDGSEQREPRGGIRALMFFQLFLTLGIVGIWVFCHP